MYRIVCFLISLTLFTPFAAESQVAESETLVMFYNVENLFDPFKDSTKLDDEYVAGGVRGWTWQKFEKKLRNISKVIIAAGSWKPPAVIGLAEVENRFVLNQLLKRTPLERFGYRIIHEESGDARGIDVALLYRPDVFTKLKHRTIPMITDADSTRRTRDILYVQGVIPTGDTLHLFVNHWPSKFGGAVETMENRAAAARSLRRVTDSLLHANPLTKIVVMGDFNDEPTDEALKDVLSAFPRLQDSCGAHLVNLAWPLMGQWDTGTQKFRNAWSMIDHFIVSDALLQQTGLRVKAGAMEIVRKEFMLEPDRQHTGKRPFRTFNGFTYQGGYSDHLPIVLRLVHLPPASIQ